MVTFPISGVETHWWLPPLTGFVLALLAVPGGVSGAFLLLPFQVSILRFTSPAVSGTNLIFNLISIPGSLLRYHREKRVLWGLAGWLISGSVVGMIGGIILRSVYLADPKWFKFFAGWVLLLLGIRLLVSLFQKTRTPGAPTDASKPSTNSLTPVSQVKLQVDWPKLQIQICDGNETHVVGMIGLGLVSLIVGVLGGAYGIGGGAILAPILVGVYRLPIYYITGATLFTTFVSSLVGVVGFWWIGPALLGASVPMQPDLMLGAAFGLGGLAGGYVGAALQKQLPARAIIGLLAAMVLFIAANYLTR